MSKPDFTEYEQRRAAMHEELCRQAGMMIFATSGACNRRLCRRKRMCDGPMVASPHQAGAIRAQQSLGLSGQACAMLPVCIAHRQPYMYEHFRKMMQELSDYAAKYPQDDIWPRLRHVAAKRVTPKRST